MTDVSQKEEFLCAEHRAIYLYIFNNNVHCIALEGAQLIEEMKKINTQNKNVLIYLFVYSGNNSAIFNCAHKMSSTKFKS